MSRRPLLSPFRTPRFNRFFDDFDFDHAFHRPYWFDYPFEDSHKFASGTGEVTDNSEQFSVTIDVSQFAPEELKVTVNDGELIIEGKHASKKDQYGEIERHFVRRLRLPNETKPELVTSELTSDGKLTIQTPKNVTEEAKVRTIPILRKDY